MAQIIVTRDVKTSYEEKSIMLRGNNCNISLAQLNFENSERKT
jgi:hypothetical protein